MRHAYLLLMLGFLGCGSPKPTHRDSSLDCTWSLHRTESFPETYLCVTKEGAVVGTARVEHELWKAYVGQAYCGYSEFLTKESAMNCVNKELAERSKSHD